MYSAGYETIRVWRRNEQQINHEKAATCVTGDDKLDVIEAFESLKSSSVKKGQTKKIRIEGGEWLVAKVRLTKYSIAYTVSNEVITPVWFGETTVLAEAASQQPGT